MNLIIRTATVKDVPSILKIINHAILHSTVVYDYTERSLEMQLDWLKKKQEEKLPVIVAEVDGEVLGYGTYGIFRPWEAYKFSVEHSVYVAHKSRGLGIGKLLITELIQIAKKEGYHSMVAGVDASNSLSVDFHKKVGFQEVGRMNEIGYKFDRWLDLVFMQLYL